MELERLLGIFPLEIWETIIDKTETSKDRNRILFALPELGNELRNKKPKWLFGEVLPVIAGKLGTSGVIGCRPVCKMWDMDIHNLLVNHACHQPYNEETNTDLPVNTTPVNDQCPLFELSTSKPVLRFRDTDSIDYFMKTSDRNTYPRGALFAQTIMLDPKVDLSNLREDFEQCSLNFLTRFGNTVKYLSFRSSTEFESAAQFYKRIYSSLLLAPNLRSLFVDLEGHYETLLEEQPLPLLPFLEYVQYKNIHLPSPGNFSHALLSYVDRAGSKIRKLVLKLYPMPSFALIICEPGQMYRPNFSNLTELSVTGCSSGLEYFKVEGAGLQKLTWQIDPLRQPVRIPGLSWNHQRPNIKFLDISGYRVFCDQELSLLNLPNLHTIVVRESFYVCYQFLLGLPSLAKLEIVYCTKNAPVTLRSRLREELRCSDDRFTMRLFQWIYYGPVKNCEIWGKLPTLQELRIKKLNLYGKYKLYKYNRKEFYSNV